MSKRSVLSVIVVITSAAAQALAQTTLYVDLHNCPGPGAGTQADPLCRIQRAIELSLPGDEIVVAPGTYNELINFIGKGVTLRGSEGKDVTIIDVEPVEDPGTGKPVVRCDNGEGPDSVLDGFTLTGGTGQATKSDGFLGGGMFNFNSNPTVMNCIFTGNTATAGGGMFNSGSSPTVTDCMFDGNIADEEGGGMASRNGSDPTVVRCTFTGNTATDGGGMHNDLSNLITTACTFDHNNATNNGGGMYNNGSDPQMTDFVFDQNSAGRQGGGMYNVSSNPTLANTMFVGNIADLDGGGIYNASSSPTVANGIFSGNGATYGGGMYNTSGSNPTVISSTFTANHAAVFGGGIVHNSTALILVNCIFSTNTSSFSAQIHNQAVTIIRFSNIEGSGGSANWQGGQLGTDGGGNIDADPLFVDADGEDNIVGTLDDNLRLLPGSSSIDAGFSFGTPVDFDGNLRVVDDSDTPDTGVGFPEVIDMGAYEFGAAAPFAVCDLDGDGDVDLEDFALWQLQITGP